MKDKENLMDELLTKAQRQSALRGELLQRHDALVREVAGADICAPRRHAAALRAVATLILFIVPSALVAACAQPSDECSVRTDRERAAVLTDVNQILEKL